MTRAHRKAKLATIEDYAAMDFAPISFQSWEPPTDDQWRAMMNPDLVNIRLAFAFCTRPKRDVVKALDAIGSEAALELCESIGQTSKYFSGLSEMLKTAEQRLLCATAAVESRRRA